MEPGSPQLGKEGAPVEIAQLQIEHQQIGWRAAQPFQSSPGTRDGFRHESVLGE